MATEIVHGVLAGKVGAGQHTAGQVPVLPHAAVHHGNGHAVPRGAELLQGHVRPAGAYGELIALADAQVGGDMPYKRQLGQTRQAAARGRNGYRVDQRQASAGVRAQGAEA